MRTLLLTAAALSAPHAAKVRAVESAPLASVSVNIDRTIAPIELRHAYDDIIAEAAALYSLDPRQNIMAGAKYLRRLLDSHKGNVRLALASYNAGPGNVAKYRAVPPFKETRNYVKKVTGLLAESND